MKKMNYSIGIIIIVILFYGFWDAQNSKITSRSLAQNSEKAFSIQMHIHGHSNHNGARDYGGSMDWHSHYAKSTDTDVVWWSDHTHTGEQDTRLWLSSATLDSDTYDIKLVPEITSHTLGLLEAEITGGEPFVEFQGNLLTMQLKSDSLDKDFVSFSYTTKSNNLRNPNRPELGYVNVVNKHFVRPLTMGARMQFDLIRWDLNENNAIEVEVVLAKHYSDQPIVHRIIYKITDQNTLAERSIQDEGLLEVLIPTQPGWNTINLDLLSDASLFFHGDDNTISQVIFRVKSKNGETAFTRFRNVIFYSEIKEQGYFFDKVHEIAGKYAHEYGVAEYVGMEANQKGSNTPHLNFFVPDKLLFDELHNLTPIIDDGDYVRMVEQVHARNGLVSYNHMFGTSFANLNPNLSEEQIESQRVGKAIELLRVNAFDANLIEIGYLKRGGENLQGHLNVWDRLTANRLFVYGTGVSDTHGNSWNAEEFKTWVWSVDSNPNSLIEGMKTGHMFFGRIVPDLKEAEFDLKLADARMGGSLETANDSENLNISIRLPAINPENYGVHLLQGLINNPPDTSKASLNYIIDRWYIGHSLPDSIDVRTINDSFLRTEIWRKSTGSDEFDDPLLFSNPIYVFHKTGVDVEAGDQNDPGIPTNFALLQNVPNPFNPITQIRFRLPEKSFVSLKIYNLQGQEIKSILEDKLPAGTHTATWDGTDSQNQKVSSGIYVYKIKAGNFTKSRKMTYLR